MEKLLSDFIDSIKYYFSVAIISTNKKYGMYTYIFEEKTENPQGKKYLVLLFSFLIFYIAGISVGKSLEAESSIFSKTYGLILSNVESETSLKDHFKFLFSLCISLEIAGFLFTKKIERGYFSKYLFYLVSVWLIFGAFLMTIFFVVNTFCFWLNIIDLARDNIVTILGLLILILFIRLFLYRSDAYLVAEEQKKISFAFIWKLIFANIFTPILLVLLMRGVLGTPPFENQLYFFNGDHNTLDLCYQALPGKNYILKTSFIAENRSSENYIYDSKNKSFYLCWTIMDKDSILRDRGDSIFLNGRDTTSINIASKTPQKIELNGIISPIVFVKLRFLYDHTDNPMIHIGLKTLNHQKIHLGYYPFKLKRE